MFRERIRPPEEASDPRVSRTRHLLQQALWEALHEADFSSISVQDITRRAQVNRATFYDHFADKFALMDYALRERFQQRLPSACRLIRPSARNTCACWRG